VEPLNLLQVSQLDFTLADDRRYPCLALARQAWQQGGDSIAVLNAANEVAVAHFLERHIRFTEIAKLINEVMERTPGGPAGDLAAILEADAGARRLASELVKTRL
jgi:1-deoxy-D-xylulose-5-phosphate reductoisomerase